MYRKVLKSEYRRAIRWVCSLTLALAAMAVGTRMSAGDTGSGSEASWTEATAAAAWSPRDGHATVVFDEMLWVLGGVGDIEHDGQYGLNDVWYSVDGIGWTLATEHAAWSPRAYHRAAVFDGKLWVLGGSLSGKNDVWYSADGVNWVQATEHAGWAGRSWHGVAVFDNKLWVSGGLFNFNDVWHSTDGVEWFQATEHAPWSSRYGHTATVFDGNLWLLGGHSYVNGLESELNDVWCSSNGVNWTEVAASADWPIRAGHTTLVFDGSLWVLGGVYGVDYPRVHLYLRNDVWRSADGVNWTQETDEAPWEARFGHTSAVFNGKLWVLGGQTFDTADGTYLNDVWYLPGAAAEGEGEGEGEPQTGPHTADRNGDWRIDLPELLRVIQFYNMGGFHCAVSPDDTEDGYVAGPGENHACAAHASDYLGGPSWTITLSELLRLIQFFNIGGYRLCPGDGTQDGYCAGLG